MFRLVDPGHLRRDEGFGDSFGEARAISGHCAIAGSSGNVFHRALSGPNSPSKPGENLGKTPVSLGKNLGKYGKKILFCNVFGQKELTISQNLALAYGGEARAVQPS
ncbi:hypothetical protein C7293_16165 [filamentous cyanobacterium CCT1]|nr:hypothetical protein C7293_16165 [filamentous cyanobacterium CCT1]PSN77838.1 hypothetical protein C8B47_20010 [filamentous cyanobacterium CCP4]